ncbi:MAG: hypothetical protein ACLP29_06785 [Dissulfurispiraceae bacterium]
MWLQKDEEGISYINRDAMEYTVRVDTFVVMFIVLFAIIALHLTIIEKAVNALPHNRRENFRKFASAANNAAGIGVIVSVFGVAMIGHPLAQHFRCIIMTVIIILLIISAVVAALSVIVCFQNHDNVMR